MTKPWNDPAAAIEESSADEHVQRCQISAGIVNCSVIYEDKKNQPFPFSFFWNAFLRIQPDLYFISYIRAVMSERGLLNSDDFKL